MKNELDEKLCSDFPLLFSDRHGDMAETCICWGFECGNGWEPLIRETCEIIEQINRTLPKQKMIVASQIKEKFGTLRFYVNNVPEEHSDVVYAAIDIAEQKSEKTCETCGMPGIVKGKGWLRCTCPGCER